MNAFEKIASDYSKARPGYPDTLWQTVHRMASVRDVPNVAVDVGSGTGISTRQLSVGLKNWLVVGIEPGPGMLEQAVRDSRDAGVEYRAGHAESIPFGKAEVGLVVAAQAVQWFDRPAFYKECHRVLAPSGFVAIMQNNRSFQESEFLNQYELILESTSPGYSRWYRSFTIDNELREAGFTNLRVQRVVWNRDISNDDFITMARSSTKMDAAIRDCGEPATIGALEALIDRYSIDRRISVPYTTELYVADV